MNGAHILLVINVCLVGVNLDVTNAQNYTKPEIVSRDDCISVTVSSVVFSSTVLPWGFDWRITSENKSIVLVSVTIGKIGESMIITPGPASNFSSRYTVSNTPDPIPSTLTPFTSVVTLSGITKDENLTLSVPGLQSLPIFRPRCSVESNDMIANAICNGTTNCSCGSEAKLTCLYGDKQVDSVCLKDSTFKDASKCPGKPLESDDETPDDPGNAATTLVGNPLESDDETPDDPGNAATTLVAQYKSAIAVGILIALSLHQLSWISA